MANAMVANRKDQKIERPVFYGENGRPTLRYQIDGYHPGWRCGIDIGPSAKLGEDAFDRPPPRRR